MTENTGGFKRILRQFIKFVFVSGAGFLIDFTAYTILTLAFGFSVFSANCISTVPAVTFVFFTSVIKVFSGKKSRVPLWAKYLIYFVYQAVLVFCVSKVGTALNMWVVGVFNSGIIFKYSKIISKIAITPITMTCNYFVMKFLTEKV